MKDLTCEILAPAGTYDALVAGVRCGADAVYLGTKAFNARRNADNFDGEELKKAVSFCHARGVKVHVTLNTLVSDRELDRAVDEIGHVCAAGADVLILQDLGVAALAAQCAPEILRHASTQMSVQTSAGVRLLKELGFSRVVLARENSKKEIAEITASSEIETECFVHGALCMCVSGQCFLSAMLGSRSGNRGMCAQPCRLPFSAQGGTGFDLSLKDMSYVRHIAEMAELGVKSFKIEGRMKRPEYVAAAVTACKRSIKGESLDDIIDDLRAVFSRSGFTDGYYTGTLGREMFGIRRKEDVTSAQGVLSRLEHLYDREQPHIAVSFALTVKTGEKVTLAASAGNKYAFCESDTIPEKALKTPVTAQSLCERMSKCGGTPFFVEECEVDVDDGLIVPASVINGLRRQALDELICKLQAVKPKHFTGSSVKASVHTSKPCKITAFFIDSDTVPDCLNGVNAIYVPYDTKIEKLFELQSRGVKVGAVIPRGLFGLEKAVAKRLLQLKSEGITLAYCQNLDAVQLAREADMEIHTGFGLNIYNTLSLNALEKLGVGAATLSFEATLSDICDLGGAIQRGVIAYGRLPLMLFRNCPIKNGRACTACDKRGELTDRMGVSFPVRCSGACSELYNSRPLWLADRLDEIRNMDFITLYFTTETKKECAEIISAYVNGSSETPAQFTRGLYYRGVT